MAEDSRTFVVKPTLFMVLMQEPETNNIRKIYFAFRDGHLWSIELNGGSEITGEHNLNEYDALVQADQQNGLIQHIMPGEVPVLPHEEVAALFQTLWGKAAAQEDYDKKQWMRLDRILRDCGYDL